MIVFLTVVGNLIRIPISGDTQILIIDLLLPLFILFWLAKRLTVHRKFPKTNLNIYVFSFVIIAVISLIYNFFALDLGIKELIISSFYLIRWIEYLFLFFIFIDLFKTRQEIFKFLQFLFTNIWLIILLGFLQFKFYPDFTIMAQSGWDPHVGRLLSTWFDPNFISGFMGFILAILLSLLTLSTKQLRPLSKTYLQIIFASGLIALMLTYSRSGLLAFAIGAFLIGLWRSKKMLIIAIIAGSFFVAHNERLQTRLIGAFNIDVTANYRIESWLSTLRIVEEKPILGVGYNTLKYVQTKIGAVASENTHSATGSDSSLLTILVTTGILGFIPFCLLYAQILLTCLKNYFRKSNNLFLRIYALGLLGGTLSLLAHCSFVNSLLFPFILVYFWLLMGVFYALQKIDS